MPCFMIDSLESVAPKQNDSETQNEQLRALREAAYALQRAAILKFTT